MKTIFLQWWRDVVYREGSYHDDVLDKDFGFWSDLVLGKGDQILSPSQSFMFGPINWLIKYFTWKKYIVLRPTIIDRGISTEDIEFHVGFWSKRFGVCKVSSATRHVSGGPFSMRMGPEDCHFFIVADKEVELSIAGYVHGDIKLY